jgi:hypothetical protein
MIIFVCFLGAVLWYTTSMNKIVLVLGVVMLISVISYQKSLAIIPGLPVAGRIVSVTPCLNGLYVIVAALDPKSAGPYVIMPTVIPHLWGRVLPTYAIAGSYLPGVQCIMPGFILPTKGAIMEFSTSMLPAIK